MKNVILLLIIILLFGCVKKEKIWHDNGILKFEVRLKDEKRNGKSIQYYPDGRIEIISYWRDGKKEGISKSFYRNGQLNIVANYLNGKANGEWIIYDSLGNIFQKYHFKDDLKNGEFQEFHSNGKLRGVGNFYNDFKVGQGFEYYEDGALFRKYYYKADSLFYFKGYSRNGELYDCILPVQISFIKNDNIKIQLMYTEYDSARIGIIIGHLNEKNQLIDTLEVIGSSNLEILYPIKKEQKRLSGKLVEIKMPEQDIEGEYYFDINIDGLKSNLIQ